VPGMEPWVIVPVEGYEIRRNLVGNSDKLIILGDLGQGRVFSHAFDIEAMADWNLDLPI
jgi:hypothetical protein